MRTGGGSRGESIARKPGGNDEHSAITERVSWYEHSLGRYTMPGPGESRPKPTLGLDPLEALPKTKIRVRIRNYRRRCGHGSYRDWIVHRRLHDLGNPLTGRPRDIILLSSQHD